MKRNYRLFNFYFFTIAWINFCIAFCFYLSTVLTTSYALSLFNTSEGLAGLASGIFIVGTMFARFFIGRVIDGLALKKWLFATLCTHFIVSLFYFSISDFWALLLVRFFHGASFGVCSSICGAIVARMIPSHQRGVGIGYYALSIVIASAIAPFLAIYYTNNGFYMLAFITMLCINVLAIVSVLGMKVREIRRGIELKIPTARKVSVFNRLHEFFEPSVWRISLLIALIAFCFGAILSFIGEYAKDSNLVLAGSLFFIVYAITSLFGRPIAGKVFDSYGHNIVLMPSIIFFFIALCLIGLIEETWGVLLAAVLTGLGYGNFFSSAQSYAIKVAPKEKMGLATSSYYMSLDFGMGIGPFFLGFIVAGFGYRAMFLVAALIVLISFFLYYILIFKKDKYGKKH